MGTRSTVTPSKRSAINAQPLPRLRSQTARQEKQLNLSDARIAVEWLNAARDAKATETYERVVSIHRQFEELRALCVKLQGHRNVPANDETHPAYKAYRNDYRRAERCHDALNKALCRYAFRPRVTYFVAGDEWRGGMVPDDVPQMFETKIGPQDVNEGDAVLCLVRLDLIGEIANVRLCENCRERWYARAKSNYKFCGDKCREDFHTNHPDYHKRKAKAQRKYRRQKKL